MIETKSIELAKQLIKKERKPVIIKAQDDNFNRKLLEYGNFDILLSIENGERRRNLRQIDSGFNHVLAAIAQKKGVKIGIDVSEIARLEDEEKAERIARIMQNVKICRKFNVSLCAINYKDKKGAFSFILSLGASTKQAKESISF
ncbi:MAG: hypothetical protein Q8Q31_03445 [Nanoarchaeota archaeon]|nr:hypothetical protein [Nanoarchaeota archaeon]